MFPYFFIAEINPYSVLKSLVLITPVSTYMQLLWDVYWTQLITITFYNLWITYCSVNLYYHHKRTKFMVGLTYRESIQNL